jgi:hypothetical protein
VQELGAEGESKGDSLDAPRSQDSDGRAEKHSNPGKKKVFYLFYLLNFISEMHNQDTCE